MNIFVRNVNFGLSYRYRFFIKLGGSFIIKRIKIPFVVFEFNFLSKWIKKKVYFFDSGIFSAIEEEDYNSYLKLLKNEVSLKLFSDSIIRQTIINYVNSFSKKNGIDENILFSVIKAENLYMEAPSIKFYYEGKDVK